MGKILGPVAILAKGERASPQARSVPPGELLKSRRLAGLGTADQLAFVFWMRIHRIRDSRVADERFIRRSVFL